MHTDRVPLPPGLQGSAVLSPGYEGRKDHIPSAKQDKGEKQKLSLCSYDGERNMVLEHLPQNVCLYGEK